MAGHDDIDLRELRALLAVVEHGSLSRAACALQVAQSTMSETIASLDRAIGTPVIARRRGGHQLQLTAAGLALVPYARNVVQQLEAARRAISSVAPQARSVITVSTVESLSTYLLPSTLAAMRTRWPNVRFAVTLAPCSAIRAQVERGECDVGLILEEALEAPRLDRSTNWTIVELARHVPLLVFSGANHPLAERPQRTPHPVDALTPYKLFVSDSSGPQHDLLRRYLTTGRLPGPRLEALGSVEATRIGVLADDRAVGILPAYALAPQLRSGQLRVLRMIPPAPILRIAACYRSQGVHPAVEALIEHARQAVTPRVDVAVAATA